MGAKRLPRCYTDVEIYSKKNRNILKQIHNLAYACSNGHLQEGRKDILVFNFCDMNICMPVILRNGF